MTILAASLVICVTFLFAHLPNCKSESAYLPANLTTNLPTWLCDYLITCQPADLPTCLPAILPNCLLAYLHSSLSVNQQIHLPAYLHTCQPTNPPAYLPTCMSNWFCRPTTCCDLFWYLSGWVAGWVAGWPGGWVAGWLGGWVSWEYSHLSPT